MGIGEALDAIDETNERAEQETAGFVMPGGVTLHPAISKYLTAGRLAGDIAFKRLVNVWKVQDAEKQLRGFINWLRARSPGELTEYHHEAESVGPSEPHVIGRLAHESPLPVQSPKIRSVQRAADLLRLRFTGADLDAVRNAIRDSPEELSELLTVTNVNAMAKLFSSCHPSIRQYHERGTLGSDERFTKQVRVWAKLAREKQVREFSRWVERENPGELRVLVAQGLIKL